MFDDFIVGQKYSVVVKDRYKDKEEKEMIKYLGTKMVSGQYGCAGNNTLGYVFETEKGVLIILTDFAKYSTTNNDYYLTIYDNFSDGREYKFVD